MYVRRVAPRAWPCQCAIKVAHIGFGKPLRNAGNKAGREKRVGARPDFDRRSGGNGFKGGRHIDLARRLPVSKCQRITIRQIRIGNSQPARPLRSKTLSQLCSKTGPGLETLFL